MYDKNPYREIIFPNDFLILNTSGTFHVCGHYPRVDIGFQKRSCYNILEAIEKFPKGFPPDFLVLKKEPQ